ncbi:unnamed protein product [Mytilus edulis]|uniref:Uncharacterized protein n=1 Tax=Mytilus edulis TaxID=6550 RepID=A0A8S3UWR2_MYTED|nr:unnamed protein product [Mytilus edulis]
MENTDDDFPLPGIESNHVLQVNEVQEQNSYSDIDPYYSDDSVTTDEKSNTSTTDDTTGLFDMQTQQMEESETPEEETEIPEEESKNPEEKSDITLIEVYRSGSMVNLNLNGLKQCADKELTLGRYYQEYFRRETIEPYPLHYVEVRVLWVPVIEEISTTGDYRSLIQLIRKYKRFSR